jgi:GT2 family glycosyltransferase
MRLSVVIRSKNEAPRLKLCLAAMTNHQLPLVPVGGGASPRGGSGDTMEVIVVDDGSTDGTAAMLAQCANEHPIHVVTQASSVGASAASNAGAKRATGDVLLFLDGDVLAGPGLVEKHAALHRSGAVVGRGETRHLRCTRYFLDPELGIPRAGCEDKVSKVPHDLEKSLVRVRQVVEQFEAVHSRSEPGIYPGMGPRKLFEMEWAFLAEHPGARLAWLTASSQNLSIPRDAFERVGGFDGKITISEGRELALRLQHRGLFVRPVVGGASYHLTHRDGWSNPLTSQGWEQAFFEKFPTPDVAIAAVVWYAVSAESDVLEARGENLLLAAQRFVTAGRDVHELRKRCAGLQDLLAKR